MFGKMLPHATSSLGKPMVSFSNLNGRGLPAQHLGCQLSRAQSIEHHRPHPEIQQLRSMSSNPDSWLRPGSQIHSQHMIFMVFRCFPSREGTKSVKICGPMCIEWIKFRRLKQGGKPAVCKEANKGIIHLFLPSFAMSKELVLFTICG